MPAGFRYNTYGPGRTRPMSPEEAHWKNLGVRMGLQMRKPPVDPLHKIPLKEKFGMHRRFEQREMAKAAVLTPNPP